MFKTDISALIESATAVIRRERSKMDPIIVTIVRYVREHKLQISAPQWPVDDHPPQDGFYIWSPNALRDSNALANEIYRNHTQIVYVKTLIPFEEFEVCVFGRSLFTVARYPQIKSENMMALYPVTHYESKQFGQFALLDPEIEIIQCYRQLYTPFPEHWPAAIALENRMYDAAHARITGGRHERSSSGHARTTPYTVLGRLRHEIYRALKNHDLGVLVGHWAYGHLTGNIPQSEKIQLVLHQSLEPDTLLRKLHAVLRDVTTLRFSHRTEDVHTPGDYWLQRTTYYVGDSAERVAVMDTFNSSTYEMVPYIIDDGVKIGGAYLLCRMLMIDKWLLMGLARRGAIGADIAGPKIRLAFDRVGEIRRMDRLKFGDQYEGVWRDPVIEKRLIIKRQDKKYPPYYPAIHERQHGSLRTVS